MAMPSQSLNIFNGIDATTAPHILGTDQVQTATNMDFSLERGAALTRRGSTLFLSPGGTNPISNSYRPPKVSSLFAGEDQAPYYFADVNIPVTSNTVYRGLPGTMSSILSLTANAGYPLIPMGLYNNYTLIAGPNQQNFKDDGSLTTEWVKQSPAGTLSISSNTLAPLVVDNQWIVTSTATFTNFGTSTTTGTGTATATYTTTKTFTFTNSTNTSTNTGTFVDVIFSTSTATDTATFTNSYTTNSTFTGTATGTVDATTFVLTFQAANLTTNLAMNGTHTIGDYGFDSLQIAFSDPSKIISVSKDYSIGDTSFTNYYHAVMDLSLLVEAVPFDSSQVGPLTTTNSNGQVRVILPGTLPRTGIGRGGAGAQPAALIGQQPFHAPNPVGAANRRATSLAAALAQAEIGWVTARPNFSVIGNTPSSDGWANVQAARITILAQGGVGIPAVNAQVTNWTIFGAQDYPLTDLANGYYYWQTWATLDASNNVIDESNPSPASIPFYVQGVQGVVVATDTPTGTLHGITHRVFYREGGLASLAYRVGYIPIGSATFTDTVPDIIAVDNNFQMVQGLYSKTTMPSISALSEPYQSRIFYSWGSNLGWGLPGMVGEFPTDSVSGVSNEVDWPQALHTWDRLVVVNRASVYEMAGSTFEGPLQDWTLQRTGSRRGTIAPKLCIKTPYGILLSDYDGFSIYYPGRGIDSPIVWANEKMADAFRGTSTTDPAFLKGGRIPAINWNGYVGAFASAAFQDDKLYCAFPTGTSTMPNTVYVMDFRTQNVWFYSYPFPITSLLWDKPSNRLLAGTDDGKVMRLENGVMDTLTNGTSTGIGWRVLTRMWTAPFNSVMENLSAEVVGVGTSSLVLDGTSTFSLSTFSNATKNWAFFPAINTSTVTTTFPEFVPGAGGSYGSFTFTNSSKVTPIVGKNISFLTQGTMSGGNPSGVYNYQWNAIEEPPNLNYFRTEMESGGGAISDTYSDAHEEKIWDEHLVTMEAFGTGSIFGVLYVDDQIIGTQTLTAPFRRQTFVQSYPAETYGYLAYTVWSGPGTQGSYTGSFKLFKDYSKVRKEPDRTVDFVTDKKVTGEQWYQQVLTDINPLGGTALGIVYVNGTVVSTLTVSGNFRQERPFALPSETYGTTIWVWWSGGFSGGGKQYSFKHYTTEYKMVPEPERVPFYETPTKSLPSENYCKTWLPELNCLGGTVVGSALVELNTGTSTYSAVLVGTFTGSLRNVYEIGYMDTTEQLQTGKTIKATYTSSTPFKHYNTNFELEPKPFGKKSWFMYFRKIGGADEMDMGRFFKYDLEVPSNGTATITSLWDVDENVVATNTLTVVGRQMSDPISFPPGIRGYLWQQRLLSTSDFQVWSTTLQSERIGVKGLTNISVKGSPIE